MVHGEPVKSRTFPLRHAYRNWSLIDAGDTVKVAGGLEVQDGRIAAVEEGNKTLQEDLSW